MSAATRREQFEAALSIFNAACRRHESVVAGNDLADAAERYQSVLSCRAEVLAKFTLLESAVEAAEGMRSRLSDVIQGVKIHHDSLRAALIAFDAALAAPGPSPVGGTVDRRRHQSQFVTVITDSRGNYIKAYSRLTGVGEYFLYANTRAEKEGGK